MADRTVIPMSRYAHTGNLAVYGHWSAGKAGNRTFRDHGNPGPNAANTSYLSTTRGRVRDAIRNTPLASRAVEILTSDVVGSGIVPRPADDGIGDLLKEWALECDADGQRDLFGLQEAAVMAWAEGGECFIRLRPRRLSDGLVVPLQLQLLEAEMLPLHDLPLNNGNRIIQGIEFNKLGQRVAYWFHKTHPGDFYTGSTDFGSLTRVPADLVIHVYEARRPGQIRGFPRLAPVLQRIQQASDFDEATIERQKQAANITFVIQRPLPDHAGIDPITGEAIEQDREVSDVSPGSAYRLLPGETFESPDLPSVGREYDAFTTWQARMISAGAGVPYEILTNDYRAVNDRTARVMLNDYRRRIEQHQRFRVIHPMCRPITRAVIDAAIMAGQLSPTVDRRVPWVPPAWPYINPVQDVESNEREVKAGFTSKRQVILSRGRDPDDVLEENVRDTEAADSNGLTFSTGLSAETDQDAMTREANETRAQALHDAEMRVRAAVADEHMGNQLLAKAKALREQAEASWRSANADLASAQAERERAEARIAQQESEARLTASGKELEAKLQAMQAERDQAIKESKARIKAAEQASRSAAEDAAARSDEERRIQAERLQVARLEREAAEAGLAELRSEA